MKLDILAFGIHPDDVELGAGGFLALECVRGRACGIVDLTRPPAVPDPAGLLGGAI